MDNEKDSSSMANGRSKSLDRNMTKLRSESYSRSPRDLQRSERRLSHDESGRDSE